MVIYIIRILVENDMQYLYGEFSDEQITRTINTMHNEIHKLLLHKDKKITEIIFDSEDDFLTYFTALLYRFGGLNKLLGEPYEMVALMSTLQAAYSEVTGEKFDYKKFRKEILDSHGYIKSISKEVFKCPV